MRVSLKAVPGVENVDVSLEKGLARVTMKPGNNATLKQLHDAIAKNGFTMKQSDIAATGKLVSNAGKLQLQVSGSNDLLQLESAGNTVDAVKMEGKTVKVSGDIPEAQKGRVPDTLRYKSIEEQK